MTDSPNDLISIGAAAKLLGMSVKTVRRWADDGDLPAERTPKGQRRFRRSDVEAAMTPEAVA
jgi:excisionase family DNA binding protein